MELTNLYEKYGVVTDGLSRYYVLNTSDRRLDMDSVTPVSLTFNNGEEEVVINSNAWNEMLTELVTYLQEHKHIGKEDLLKITVDWSSAKPFRDSKDIVNVRELEEGLYFSVNYSANHSSWMIDELLKLYGLDSGTLVVHRAIKSEPQEIRDTIKEIRVKEFKNFLMEVKGLTEEKSEKVINAINGVFNKMLQRVRPSFYDFFLFDNVSLLSNLKSIIIADLPYKYLWDEKKIKTAKKYLDYLTDYYTTLKKNAKAMKGE